MGEADNALLDVVVVSNRMSVQRGPARVQAGLDRTAAGMELLDALSVECRRIATPLEAAVVEAQLDRLRAYSTLG